MAAITKGKELATRDAIALWGLRLVVGTILVIALAYYFGAGYPGAYYVMGLSLMAIVWSALFRLPVWRLSGNAARPMLLGAFGLILLAFTISARKPADIGFAVNFLFLAAFVPLSGIFERLAAPRNLERVALLCLAGAVFAAGLALYQVFIVGQHRATGWGSDPIWSAEAALITGFLTIIGWYAPQGRLPRPVYLLGPLLGCLTTFLSGSRGPLVAIPLIVIGVMILGSRGMRAWLAAGIGLLVVVGIALYGFWPGGAARFDSLFTNMRAVLLTGAAPDGSVDARLIFWRIGTLAFLDAPIAGYGWAHFLAQAYTYLPDGGAAFNAGLDGLAGNKHLHSDILDLGVSAGLMGLCAYGLVLAAPLVSAVRSPHDTQRQGRIIGAVIVTTGYFACGLTYLMLGFEYHTTLYAILVATITGICRDTPPLPARQPAELSRADDAAAPADRGASPR